jgi:mutator protein MutT
VTGRAAWPQVGVGAVVVRNGQVLLIRRRNPPLEGRWTLPGGRVEAGESLEAAVVREVLEETGVEVTAAELLVVVDPVERDASGAVLYHFVILDYACEWVAGEPHAASDADAARWVPRSQLEAYDLPAKTLEVVLMGFARDTAGEPSARLG